MNQQNRDKLLSTATFSPCRTWRYTLTRRWDDGPQIAFIGLNPSTADETEDDPTIRRCIGFAKREGAGGLVMLNLFAFRATDPKAMKAALDPVGPDNDLHIRLGIQSSMLAICCWGSHGVFQNRSARIRNGLKQEGHADKLRCLGKTKSGAPKHPLYLKSDTPLEAF